MLKIGTMLLLFLGIGCGEPSDEEKMRLTQEAFKRIKFDPRVSQSLDKIDAITDLIISNIDQIFLRNGINEIYGGRDGAPQSLSFYSNTMDQFLPADLADSLRLKFKELPHDFIFCITISNDQSISYIIRPEEVQTERVYYRVQHGLIYGKRLSTKRKLRSVLGSLTKAKVVGGYQYYIKVEPYNGW